MKDQGGEQDRSEPASSYKLDRARRRGAIARGVDLGFVSGLIGATGWFAAYGVHLWGTIAETSRRAFISGPQIASGATPLLTTARLLTVQALSPALGAAVAIFIVVLAMEIVQNGGFFFAPEAVKFDFSRLSPTVGLKRVFSVRALLELIKNLVKLAIYTALSYFVFTSVERVIFASPVEFANFPHEYARYIWQIILVFIFGAIVFAGADQVLTRRDFSQRMRMSRREKRREMRDREGDPRLKQRRRKLHGDFVKTSGGLKNVKGSDLIVVNPTHYAVGLCYRSAEMQAPKITSRGANRFALEIKRAALLYGVVVIEQPELARLLYRVGGLDQEIPDIAVTEVAKLYRRLRDDYGKTIL